MSPASREVADRKRPSLRKAGSHTTELGKYQAEVCHLIQALIVLIMGLFEVLITNDAHYWSK